MNTSEVVNARIDALTSGLSQAVQKSGGAQFALMLSMISESQVFARQLSENESAAQVRSVDRNLLYDAEIVGRLNRSLKNGQLGDVQLMLSWLETVPLQGRARVPVAMDDSESGVAISQAAVMARHYSMLEEIGESQLRGAA